MFLKTIFNFKLVCKNLVGDSRCNGFKDRGYCKDDWETWMEINCRKACNLCAGKWYNFDVCDQ